MVTTEASRRAKYESKGAFAEKKKTGQAINQETEEASETNDHW